VSALDGLCGRVVETIPDAAYGRLDAGLGNRSALLDRDDDVKATVACRKTSAWLCPGGGMEVSALPVPTDIVIGRNIPLFIDFDMKEEARVADYYHWLQKFGRTIALLLIMPPEISHCNRNLTDCGKKTLIHSFHIW